ncbi:hypothetical protein EAG_09156 [Camponotus floridanus]|uniref:Uncharacterized protein n=1 Tax=Camponotus floridanus TaxID=104421 RepID=E2AI56_CAMFO|nr:hypothetical protein EAG_09156 [Camponotus floridanus]
MNSGAKVVVVSLSVRKGKDSSDELAFRFFLCLLLKNNSSNSGHPQNPWISPLMRVDCPGQSPNYHLGCPARHSPSNVTFKTVHKNIETEQYPDSTGHPMDIHFMSILRPYVHGHEMTVHPVSGLNLAVLPGCIPLLPPKCCAGSGMGCGVQSKAIEYLRPPKDQEPGSANEYDYSTRGKQERHDIDGLALTLTIEDQANKNLSSKTTHSLGQETDQQKRHEIIDTLTIE